METITVLDRQVSVDIREEVLEFEWDNAKITDDKLIACSPFRDDNTPSFWINFTGEYAGVFGDSAWDSDYYKSGTLPKLLAYLRNETYEEACLYLLKKYDYDYSEGDIPLMVPGLLDTESKIKEVPKEYYEGMSLDKSYLPGRGIHPKVVEMNGIFDNGNSIGIIWRSMDGVVRAIKYRHKTSKEFWYYGGGTPVSNLVWGLDIVLERSITTVVICEAEIDAMTWQSAGVFAVAIGGARFNDVQAEQIIQSGVENVIVAGDNDKAGNKFNALVESKLKRYVKLSRLTYQGFEKCKDVNDIGAESLRKMKIVKVPRKKVAI